MHDWLLSIEPWAEVWAASLWKATWQGTLVMGLAWVIDRTCTFLSPRVVCWIWRAACLKVLASLLWVQPVSLALLPPQPSLPLTVATDLATPAALGPLPLATTALASARSKFPTHPTPSTVSIATLLVLAWATGFCCRLAASVRQWILLRRLRRSVAPASAAFLQRLLDEEATHLQIRRRPWLGISPTAEGPLLTGLWRPLVVLPTQVEELFGERELRIMLAHELAHCQRHDLAWNWLATCVGWILFFHPLAWLMTRRWCETQEAACDELLIQRRVTGPTDYGRLLVKLARQLPREPRSALAAAGMLKTYHNLERRIQAMTRVRPFSYGRHLAAATLLTLMTLPAIVPWRLVAQEANRSTSQAGPAQNESFLIADGQDDPAIQQSAVSFPGKIYARASLEYKNEAGAMERYDGIVAIDPNTAEWKKIGEFGHNFQLSPDRTRYLYCTSRHVPNAPEKSQSDIWMADAKVGAPVQIAAAANLPLWSPDGKAVLYFKGEDSEDRGVRGSTWLYDLQTKQSKKLPIPETDEVDDWSREGNWLVTVSDRHPPHGSGYQLYVMHSDRTGERRLTEGALNCYPKFSPNGKRIVYARAADLFSLWVVDVDGSSRKQVMIENPDGSDAPEHAGWSPDGQWLAVKLFNWQTRTNDDGKRQKYSGAGEGNDRIVILAPDGTNRRVLQLKGVLKTHWLEDPKWH